MRNLIKVALSSLALCIVQINARCDESPDYKLKAYKIATEIRKQLEVSILENQKLFNFWMLKPSIISQALILEMLQQ